MACYAGSWNETVDGEYQNYKAKGGAYTREHFFGKHPQLLAMVANFSDDEVWRLNRGGHDPSKVYAAYERATRSEGRPTVILAKTVKGFGLGAVAEGREHEPPAEEARRRRPACVSGSVQHPGLRRGHFEGAVLSSARRQRRTRVSARTASASRWLSAAAPTAGCVRAQDSGARGLQGAARRYRRARGIDDDGFRQDSLDTAQGQDDRQVRRADRSRRGAHVRNGGPVPPGRHLRIEGPAVHAAGRRPADVLSRGQERTDPRGRHQ